MISAPPFSFFLLVCMLLAVEFGRQMGFRRIAIEPNEDHAAFHTVEAAVFGLFALLVAFTFSGAADRFNSRRMLIAEEANDIGTAYLRVDLLSAGAQPILRDLFRRYLDSRLTVYRKLPDLTAARQELTKSEELQREIWANAVSATRSADGHPNAGILLLPALNVMFDITTTRTMAAFTHPPNVIYILLFAVGIAVSFLAGYGMATSRRRSWIHILGLVAPTVVVVFIILDIEYPRSGWVRLDEYDRVLVDLRRSMR